MMRVGLLGGTFDPVHNGHLELAETALRLARLDAVYFVTAYDPPHKSRKGLANFLDRHAMVALALMGNPKLIPSSMEYERAGKSYSVDTVRQLKESLGTFASVFFLIGMDAFLEITSWKEHQAFPELCSFIIFGRPGFTRENLTNRLPDSLLARMSLVVGEKDFDSHGENRLYLFEEFSSNISSTEIRDCVRLGRPISGWVPGGVAEYIYKTRLYFD
jgi:nicotinate-nucleotide adenylyltransferase